MALSCVSSSRASRGFATRKLAVHAPARVSTRVVDVTQETFETEVLKAPGPVLVDFWANWCGPCKLVAPLMVWMEKEYAGKLKVVKIDTTISKELVEEYKVYGLPAFIIFKDGQPVEGTQREGAMTKAALQEYVKPYV